MTRLASQLSVTRLGSHWETMVTRLESCFLPIDSTRVRVTFTKSPNIWLTKQTQSVYTQEIRFFYFSDDQYWRKCSVSIVFPSGCMLHFRYPVLHLTCRWSWDFACHWGSSREENIINTLSWFNNINNYLLQTRDPYRRHSKQRMM